MTSSETSQRTTLTDQAGGRNNDGAPKIIGLYGIPGSGKTWLLEHLPRILDEDDYEFFDRSAEIEKVTRGGLAHFKTLNEHDRLPFRGMAIKSIKDRCAESGKVGVVAGHFMFWEDPEQFQGTQVCTSADLATYTHVIYLDVSADMVAQQRAQDKKRQRKDLSAGHLEKWQREESRELQDRCAANSIIVCAIPVDQASMLQKVSQMLEDFRRNDEGYNLSLVEKALDEAVHLTGPEIETMLVIDGDKTLAPEDTGKLFLSEYYGDQNQDPLKAILNAKGYTYHAFRHIAMFYEGTGGDAEFDRLCERVAKQISVHPKFDQLLQNVRQQTNVGAVVITCGLKRVWDIVLHGLGLEDSVTVIGGGRVADGYVVTPEVKGALVIRLKHHHQKYVWAFGDSPLDIEMLCEADQAIVVVGELNDRSKSMEAALQHAIDQRGLLARQLRLPPTAPARLDISILPEFVLSKYTRDKIFASPTASLSITNATGKTASRLLASPTRDSLVKGPQLRECHRQAGWYLAIEYLTDLLGLDEKTTQDVHGESTTGYQLQSEQNTRIIPLMRGGEPMAFGVSDAFPLATFVHAKEATDIKPSHIANSSTVILVDWVINSGKSILEFVKRVRSIDRCVRIVIVAGVVQADALKSMGPLVSALNVGGEISLVTLRTSDRKYTGKGGTDTGNRLFNTTHLD
ncbi:hypothetical protein LTR37_009315 [Vermiconidia calcicola]|uniref:Uncharacterized protein n=1 Tax=Vermiconidia calcicola TaxID=1690605 RepID=A0ACC3N8H4_9PEZI|nr:hypothetical protein LTR37_009315 [Vermiconidia calcicola]